MPPPKIYAILTKLNAKLAYLAGFMSKNHKIFIVFLEIYP